MRRSDSRGNGSLSGKIFKLVSIFTLAILLAFAGVFTIIFYLSYERDAENHLIAQARNAAQRLDTTNSQDREWVLESQFSGDVRFTLIDAEGAVLFDSYGDAGVLGNHADRPEVQQARENGFASATRYSETLRTNTVYAAVALEDGSVVRLAETRDSLLAFLEGLIAPILASLVVAVISVFFLSRLLAKRIMKPIDALDFTKPLDNEIYTEMEPLLKRIDEQQTQLKKQNLELAQAENLRRDFSSNVSHEMKTPLQVISGYAELMQNDMVIPEDRQKVAALIYDEAQTMRSLIDDVLILSRLDESAIENDVESIDLYSLALHVDQRLKSFAESYQVTVTIEGERAFIAGNATLAEEMLYNFVENGIRYNRPQGTVKVFVGNEEGWAIVRIIDNGLGMPEEMKEKVFERFFRIDKSRSKETGGTGLGLAISKHAVLYHRGSIEVQTRLGEGTSFILRFPSTEHSSLK